MWDRHSSVNGSTYVMARRWKTVNLPERSVFISPGLIFSVNWTNKFSVVLTLTQNVISANLHFEICDFTHYHYKGPNILYAFVFFLSWTWLRMYFCLLFKREKSLKKKTPRNWIIEISIFRCVKPFESTSVYVCPDLIIYRRSSKRPWYRWTRNSEKEIGIRPGNRQRATSRGEKKTMKRICNKGNLHNHESPLVSKHCPD